MVVLGAVGTLLGVLLAMVWPRLSGPAFALGGIVSVGLAGSFPGAQATDPAIALMFVLFGVPVLVATWKYLKG